MPDLILEPVMEPDPNKLEDAYEVVEDVQAKSGGVAIKVPKFSSSTGPAFRRPRGS